MHERSLVNRTYELYNARSRLQTQQVIADATGLSVHWINQFACRRSLDPGANKVQILYEYLTGRKLEVV